MGIEDMEDKEVTSPAIVSRLEGVLGVNTGERIKVLIPRSQLQTGIGERERERRHMLTHMRHVC